jgi:hypothetical protein
MSNYSSDLLSFKYISNKGWVRGGRSSFEIRLKLVGSIPNQDVLNDLWKVTKGAYGYLAVSEYSEKRAVITLPPGTSENTRNRFIAELESYIRSKW